MKKLVLALTVVTFCSVSFAGSPLNRIQKENRQPGTTAWQLTNPADNHQIEGYASLTSVLCCGIGTGAAKYQSRLLFCRNYKGHAVGTAEEH